MGNERKELRGRKAKREKIGRKIKYREKKKWEMKGKKE